MQGCLRACLEFAVDGFLYRASVRNAKYSRGNKKRGFPRLLFFDEFLTLFQGVPFPFRADAFLVVLEEFEVLFG